MDTVTNSKIEIFQEEIGTITDESYYHWGDDIVNRYNLWLKENPKANVVYLKLSQMGPQTNPIAVLTVVYK